MTFSGSDKNIAHVLTMVVLCLILAHVTTCLLRHYQGYDYQFGLHRQANYFLKNNVPTWYVTSALLACAGLVASIWRFKKREGDRYTRHWLALAVIFLYLSIDETGTIDEVTTWPLRAALHATGYLCYAWVIPGAIGVLMVSLAHVQFLATLPPPTRCHLSVASSVYLSGALGMKLLQGMYASLYGNEPVTYWALHRSENGFDMLAVVLFIYSPLSYMGAQMAQMTFRITDGVAISNMDPVPT